MIALLVIGERATDSPDHRDLAPCSNVLAARVERLADAFRGRGWPVIHATVGHAGDDRCSRHREATPERLDRRLDGEICVDTRLTSVFAGSDLERRLADLDVRTIAIVGSHLHSALAACARDGLACGLGVWIVEDAVATTLPDAAELAHLDLAAAGVAFRDSVEIISEVAGVQSGVDDLDRADAIPAANIKGRWIGDESPPRVERRNPADWHQLQTVIEVAGSELVAAAAQGTADSGQDWSRQSVARRVHLLEQLVLGLDAEREPLAQLLAEEIGKPLQDGRAEIDATGELIRHTARSITQMPTAAPESNVEERHLPHGLVGLITPWNNPVMIPLGKIAPAVAWGNAVVWKPALEAPRVAVRVMDLLHESGLPPGVVSLVFGGSRTARAVIDHPLIAAISLTGSIDTGRAVAARCGRRGIPLQAELGGNNAAIVLDDCDVEAFAHQMVRASFSFAGQRCTAIRRWIVQREILDDFVCAFANATSALHLGDPQDPRVDVGPLVSRDQRARLRRAVDRAEADGAHVLQGGHVPPELSDGCWLEPIVMADAQPGSWIAQVETFGPLALILPADDLDHALGIANEVEHGLVAGLYSQNPDARDRFAEAAQAGILQFVAGPARISAEAPFGGWKASGMGPPEHGAWDRVFYTRPQALYRTHATEQGAGTYSANTSSDA